MIHYLTVVGLTGAAIKWKIKKVYNEVISGQMINRWRTMILDGRADLNDGIHAVRSNFIDKTQLNCWLLEQDLQLSVSEIEKYFQDVVCNPLSHGTILTINHDHLEKKKVSTRWFSNFLIDDHKVSQLAVMAQFLTLYNTEGEDVFDKIVTSQVMGNGCINLPSS